MKFLTIEQSKKFIPISEDGYTHMEPHFFTSVNDNDGWSEIFYFTNKPKKEFAGEFGEHFVYVLSNQYMPGLVKIGFTALNPYDRAMYISKSTGVPDNFEVDFAFRCIDGRKLEKMVHIHLNEFRVKKQREFFKMEIQDAIETIINIGSSI